MSYALDPGRRAGTTHDTARVLLHVGWMALALGVAMELLGLFLALPSGGVGGWRPVLAETFQKVSWSWFVCIGLAAGTAATKMRVPAMGLAGFIAAPIAFQIARVAHKAASQALGLTAPGGGSVAPLAIAALKAFEYACLGILLGWIGRRPWGRLGAHLLAGLACGVVFGGIALALKVSAASGQLPPAVLLSGAINEIAFPAGCALVVFAAESLGRSLRAERGDPPAGA